MYMGVDIRTVTKYYPEKQYGGVTAVHDAEKTTFDDLRFLMKLQIEESLPKWMREHVEYAGVEKRGQRQMAWLYPGVPRAKEPHCDAFSVLEAGAALRGGGSSKTWST